MTGPLVRFTAIATLCAVLALSAGPASTQEPVSQTSAASVAPQSAPTYVSELAPAISIAPKAAQLPASGLASRPSGPSRKLAGAGLAVVGASLLYAGLALRRRAFS